MHRRKIAGALTLVISFIGAGASPVQADDARSDTPANFPSAVYPYPASGVLIGQGWDTFNDTGTAGSCVDVDAVKLERTSFDQEVSEIQSSVSLLKNVQTSVSAAYKGTGAKASASVSVANSRKVNADAQNFLFSFESWDGSTFAVAPNTVRHRVIDNPGLLEAIKSEGAGSALLSRIAMDQPLNYSGSTVKLTKEAKRLLAANPVAFRRLCGEGFVAAIHRGVRVHILLSQFGGSTEQKNSLRATLSASGYGASVKASHSASTASANASLQLGYRIMQEGGIPIRPQSIAEGGIAVQSKAFKVKDILPDSEALMANPTAFRVVVVPYANIDAAATNSPLPTPLQLMTLGDYFIALEDLHNVVQGIAASATVNPNGDIAFPDYDPALMDRFGGMANLERLSAIVLNDLKLLEQAISSCYDRSGPCTVADAMKNAKLAVAEQIADAKLNIAANQLQPGQPLGRDADKRIDAAVVSSLLASEDKLLAGSVAEAKQIEILEDVDDSLDDTGELDPAFFQRFYWVLGQLPPKKSEFNPNWTVPNAAEGERRAAALSSGLAQVMLQTRLLPWREFFCESAKSEYLCIPETDLRSFVASVDFDSSLKVVPPPPPKKKKKHKRCRPVCL